MWSLKKKKNQKIEEQEKIKVVKSVKLGETFNLESGETVSFEVPIPAKIIDGHLGMPVGKIVASFEDKYGNKYEAEADIDIKDMIEKGIEKRINGDTKIVYYGPFKKRLPMIVMPILIVGIVGIIAYLVTNSVMPLIIGIGVVTVLEIITEIVHMRVNKRYKYANKIEIVKEV